MPPRLSTTLRTHLANHRIKAALIAFAVFAALLILPIPASLEHSFLSGAIQNAAHGPLFAFAACLTAALFGNSTYRAYAVIFIILALLAAGSEVAQLATDRSVSWHDVLNNLLGVVLGLALWMAWFDRGLAASGRIKAGLALVAAASVVVILLPLTTSVVQWVERQQSFPVLFDASFTRALSMTESLGELDEVEITVVDEGLSVKLIDQRRPGVVLTQFLPDWRGYEALVIELENPSTGSMRMETHVRDRLSDHVYNDRFNAETNVEAGQILKLVYPLADIRQAPKHREADLADMAVIAIYRLEGQADEFIVRSVHLE